MTVVAEPLRSEVDALLRVFKSRLAPGTIDSICSKQIVGVSKKLNDDYLSQSKISYV